MNRFQRRRFFSGIPPVRSIGLLVLMGFALFISFRIFTPPTRVIQILSAPDGSREARLINVFYHSEPGYKISVRRKKLWQTLFYLADYPQVPLAEREKEVLRWSADSKKLFFEVNGKRVWSYDFPAQSSRLK